ncbi:hypothetical protein C8R46DRAFT_1042151 [Mycena filopes]|nr:hypothetical protein C8R46DRAFT_1042151 [Mycena filopes]
MQSPDTLNPSFFINTGHWSLAAYPDSRLAHLTEYRLSLDQTRRNFLNVFNSCRPNTQIQTCVQKIDQHLGLVDTQMQQINQHLWLVKYGMQSLSAYICSGSPGLPLNPFHPDPQLPSSTHGNYFDRRFPEDSDSPLSARVEELNAEHETHPAPIDSPKLQPGPADIVSAEALPPTEAQPTKNGEELKLDSAIRLVMLRSLGIPFDRNILITVRAEQYTTLVESAAYVNGDNDARQPTLDPMCPCWEDLGGGWNLALAALFVERFNLEYPHLQGHDKRVSGELLEGFFYRVASISEVYYRGVLSLGAEFSLYAANAARFRIVYIYIELRTQVDDCVTHQYWGLTRMHRLISLTPHILEGLAEKSAETTGRRRARIHRSNDMLEYTPDMTGEKFKIQHLGALVAGVHSRGKFWSTVILPWYYESSTKGSAGVESRTRPSETRVQNTSKVHQSRFSTFRLDGSESQASCWTESSTEWPVMRGYLFAGRAAMRESFWTQTSSQVRIVRLKQTRLIFRIPESFTRRGLEGRYHRESCPRAREQGSGEYIDEILTDRENGDSLYTQTHPWSLPRPPAVTGSHLSLSFGVQRGFYDPSGVHLDTTLPRPNLARNQTRISMNIDESAGGRRACLGHWAQQTTWYRGVVSSPEAPQRMELDMPARTAYGPRRVLQGLAGMLRYPRSFALFWQSSQRSVWWLSVNGDGDGGKSPASGLRESRAHTFKLSATAVCRHPHASWACQRATPLRESRARTSIGFSISSIPYPKRSQRQDDEAAHSLGTKPPAATRTRAGQARELLLMDSPNDEDCAAVQPLRRLTTSLHRSASFPVGSFSRKKSHGGRKLAVPRWNYGIYMKLVLMPLQTTRDGRLLEGQVVSGVSGASATGIDFERPSSHQLPCRSRSHWLNQTIPLYEIRRYTINFEPKNRLTSARDTQCSICQVDPSACPVLSGLEIRDGSLFEALKEHSPRKAYLVENVLWPCSNLVDLDLRLGLGWKFDDACWKRSRIDKFGLDIERHSIVGHGRAGNGRVSVPYYPIFNLDREGCRVWVPSNTGNNETESFSGLKGMGPEPVAILYIHRLCRKYAAQRWLNM